ncbi:hypothetical protein GKE82_11310 [Conexibacter sp. W3-3-2]|uniref:ArdC family protein n=1 Tax=Conexibacter sp. W3-3-2 TaxID=2675227 RepID=UPI0012B8ED60|nr:ArdC-like ssDNA-binding domain-containing protein [Conexibacter sp. W3-3-2]MTD44862.1 hypothetical protein [Conexibacter sp. W3-3-2]
MALTEQQRADRRAADRDRLEAAAGALLTSDGWQHWVQVRARNGLARYSLNNQLLIALQAPRATYIAGFRAFLDLGSCVRKGEKAIRILAPIPPKKSERDDADSNEDENRIRFRAVPVFDVSQTEPLPDREPTPLEPETQPVTGDSHAHLIPKLEIFAGELGYTVERQDTGTAGGWCDSRAKTIAISAALPPNGQVRVLVHELAHALGITYTSHTRAQAEVLVDTVTYIVCGSVGLDVSGEAIPYVAGWGEDGAIDAIREYATTVDAIARRLEEVIGVDAP